MEVLNWCSNNPGLTIISLLIIGIVIEDVVASIASIFKKKEIKEFKQ